MSILKQFSSTPIAYVPAVLQHHKNGCGWLIVYYIYNPVSEMMEKKRIRVNRLHKALRNRQEFLHRCNDIICDINIRLKSGWTPYGESQNARQFEYVTDVFEKFLDEKRSELREASARSYESFTRILSQYINTNLPNCKCQLFTHYHAVCFMDHIYGQRKKDGSRLISAKTYNNYIKIGSAVFNWFVEKQYIKENPFSGFHKKKEEVKKRIIIPPEDRYKIRVWCENNSLPLLIISELVFFSLIRPKEISRLQIEDLQLSQKRILIPGHKTKNGKERMCPLSESLVLHITEHLQRSKRYKSTDYLFSERQHVGSVPIVSTRYDRIWARMRKATGLSDKYQLYSLRDTGINNMIRSGIDPLTVMQIADHHDLEMTTRYADHYDESIISLLNERGPEF